MKGFAVCVRVVDSKFGRPAIATMSCNDPIESIINMVVDHPVNEVKRDKQHRNRFVTKNDYMAGVVETKYYTIQKSNDEIGDLVVSKLNFGDPQPIFGWAVYITVDPSEKQMIYNKLGFAEANLDKLAKEIQPGAFAKAMIIVSRNTDQYGFDTKYYSRIERKLENIIGEEAVKRFTAALILTQPPLEG